MDIISHLSDDLLLKILSCVPIKDVVATSLLSKRWRFLWMLMWKLDYDDTNHIGGYKIFSKFVNRSLMCNKAPVLENLRLSLVSEYPAVDIRLWIDLAVTRRVRDLEICIRFHSTEGSDSLPSSLYNSDTLETLNLCGYVLLNAPILVCLPSLKHLILNYVDYIDNATLPQLLSGCPKLETLYVRRRKGDITDDVAVVVPSLKVLVLSDKNGGKHNGFVIVAPGLKYLKITDNVDYDFLRIENMPELAVAYVDITQKVTLEFLQALTSVRKLSLRLSLSEVTHLSGMIFNRLVHLELHTTAKGWWDLLTLMLQGSPKLQTLKLNDSSDPGKETPIGRKPAGPVPECLLSSLKAFVWIGYKGRRGDKKMAKYVLRNAACMKKATFSTESTDLGEKYRMNKELASVATLSTSCRILFD